MLQHEFRTPLSTAIMLVATLMKMSLSSAARKKTQIVHSSLQLLMNILNGLLDLRSAEMGTFRPKFEVFDPRDVFTLVKEIFTPDAALARIELDFTELAPEAFDAAQPAARISETPYGSVAVLPRMLRGDKTRLTQVIVNLVRNAFKFTVGGKVRILAAYDGDAEQLRVHVQDNGTGIDPADHAKIFEMDSTVAGTLSLNREGLGMGLHICKTIVTRFDGDITVTSEGRGKGSTFTFSMKMDRQEEMAHGVVATDLVEPLLPERGESQLIPQEESKADRPGEPALAEPDRAPIPAPAADENNDAGEAQSPENNNAQQRSLSALEMELE